MEIEHWLRRHVDRQIKISNLEKIMGMKITNDIVDKTIIAAKRVIYRNRQYGEAYSLREVKSLLKSQMILEEYHSYVEGNDVHFLETW